MSYLKMVPTYQRPSQPRRTAMKRIEQAVRENPGISVGELASLLYANAATTKRPGLIGMLIDLQLNGKITRDDGRCYPVEGDNA